MPEKSGFFDSTATDTRAYPAREFAEYFARFIKNGVFSGGTFLKVVASGTDANVSIQTGYGWINGYLYGVYDTALTLPIQAATTLDRIDRVVLRLDVSAAVRSIKAVVLQGTPSTTPTAPSLTRSGDVYDLSLAQVRVNANSSIVLPSNITDERLNNDVCGIVTGLIDQANTTSIFNQFQSFLDLKTAEYQLEWDEFIESVQDKGFATPQYVDTKANAAETNAKNASLPRAGGALTGPLRFSTWGEVSASTGGYVLYGQNCYLDASGVVYRYRNTHATMGARGIVFRLGNGLEGAWVFDMGMVAATAGASFTPTLKRILNTDDYNTLNTQFEQSDLWGAL